MLDKLIGWMARPKTRRALIILRIARYLAILIGILLIVAAFKVGTHS